MFHKLLIHYVTSYSSDRDESAIQSVSQETSQQSSQRVKKPIRQPTSQLVSQYIGPKLIIVHDGDVLSRIGLWKLSYDPKIMISMHALYWQSI